MLCAGIFDVDGVLLASPHEQAWRDALAGYADPAAFTTEIYQARVAGKPRADGALAGLKAMGVADPESKAAAYAEAKQARLEVLITEGAVTAFPDALRFVQAAHDLGWPLAVASSSKNANAMMAPIRLESGLRLLDAFRANVCGRDLAHGKPDPELFRLAAAELGASAWRDFKTRGSCARRGPTLSSPALATSISASSRRGGSAGRPHDGVQARGEDHG
jgi:beta-phosphoglucomutase-like phosphatase (HAD superfamily)